MNVRTTTRVRHLATRRRAPVPDQATVTRAAAHSRDVRARGPCRGRGPPAGRVTNAKRSPRRGAAPDPKADGGTKRREARWRCRPAHPRAGGHGPAKRISSGTCHVAPADAQRRPSGGGRCPHEGRHRPPGYPSGRAVIPTSARRGTAPRPVGRGAVGDGRPESREPGDCPAWWLPETAQANRLIARVRRAGGRGPATGSRRPSPNTW
jgi:hypothetical protein